MRSSPSTRDNIVDSHFVSAAMDRTFAQGYDVLTAIEIPRISLRAGFPPDIPSGSCARRASSTIPCMKLYTNPRHLRHGLSGLLQNHRRKRWLAVSSAHRNIIQFHRLRDEGLAHRLLRRRDFYDEPVTFFPVSGGSACVGPAGFIRSTPTAGCRLRGRLRGPIRFSCYDMLMTVAPCTLLTIAAVFSSFCCVTMLSLPSFSPVSCSATSPVLCWIC